jgi:cubilin
MATGMIVSPNYPNTYKNNSECEWEIVVDEGYHIGLQFRDRFFIESSLNCTRDFLEVLN